MITHKKGDLLQLFRDDEVQVILHVANCQGVMGSGIALQIKQQFPEAYESYKRFEELFGLSLGSNSYTWVDGAKLIANLHAQGNYGYEGGRYINYEALYESMVTARIAVEHGPFGLESIIGVPKFMGSFRAGGDWRIVEKMIEVVFEDFNVTIVEYDK